MLDDGKRTTNKEVLDSRASQSSPCSSRMQTKKLQLALQLLTLDINTHTQPSFSRSPRQCHYQDSKMARAGMLACYRKQLALWAKAAFAIGRQGELATTG